MIKGAWWADVHRVTKSRTRLKQLSSSSSSSVYLYICEYTFYLVFEDKQWYLLLSDT